MKNRDTSLLDKAINYATRCHKNTFRKGKNVPYIVHPLEAMSIVASITDDSELMAAACLHDVLEDTEEATYDDLLKEFGKRIADIVKMESNNFLPNYKNLSWKEKREQMMEELKKAPLEVKIVALGDKLSNIRQIYNDYQKDKINFFNRFNEKNPLLHKWRYYELLNCFSGLEETNAYKEFKLLVIETFKDVE